MTSILEMVPVETPLDDESAVVTLVIPGEPVSKARARIRVVGKKVSSYTPARTVTAQERVADEFRDAGFEPTTEWDFGLRIEFRLGTWQRRDIDNLAKLVLDAGTGVIWVDDVQVRRVSMGLDRGSDDPGTTVSIWRLPAQRVPSSPCGSCGRPVRTYPSWAGVRFCDAACRRSWEANRRERDCVVCGTRFMPTSRRPRVTCGQECFLAVQSERAGRPRKPLDTPEVERRKARDREYRRLLRKQAKGVAVSAEAIESFEPEPAHPVLGL